MNRKPFKIISSKMIVSHRPRTPSPTFLDPLSNSFDSLNLSPTSSSYNPLNTPTLPFAYDRRLHHWVRISPSHQPPPHPTGKPIQFFTWNLNISTPYSHERAYTLLNHIRKTCAHSTPAIINLQGIDLNALTTILTHSWVREFFQLSDIEPVDRCCYFTLTLVSHSLPVTKVLRVPFKRSNMNRDVLVVDIKLERNPRGYPSYTSIDSMIPGGVLRVANVHLESTVDGFLERPYQLQTVARLLSQPHVVAGIVGGDLNALCREDHRLPELNGLRDAFHRDEGRAVVGPRYKDIEEEMGYTWGLERMSRVPPMRRDKVLYIGDVGFARDRTGRIVTRVGARLTCEVGGRGYVPVSEHCGLMTQIVVGERRKRRREERILYV
ncbi:hypothetical protein EX30DRAFT_339413 [Ascodesmis nigricans]|uniref:Endonuclease/exonuclease/phosphatase domain-containing protein n=1 Tax=Ascodesmis nigricans TaxID=341454 RepID=A0A4V3SJA1_9PEZI|nr:hypothetical protein EX30DRAFT_339413 [Ascodesmis nigricans]